MKKCQQAKAAMEADASKEGKKLKLVTLVLDTSSLASTKKFADDVKSKFPERLDHVVFNAGIGVTPSGNFESSVDGFDLIFATNHLGFNIFFIY
jgi:NAD(P)-dependent dehydrogenase (short-subunit alcohol dehydrogenase family)